MNYRLLGHSGLRVSELCLGTMTFGEDWGWGAPREEARKIYDTFREEGGNFIDTANLYNCGHSEKIIGEYFAQNVAKRQRTVIATKFFSDLHFNGSRWAKSGCSASITCGVGTAATSDRFRSREFGAF